MTLRLVLAAALLALPSCKDDPAPPAPLTEGQFPPGFLWGTAIAGFQVDMGCPTLTAAQCDDPNSDWYAWVMTPELKADTATHLSNHPVSAGPGHWELYEQDYDLAKDTLNANAQRLSFEWSRIFPTSTAGVEGYEALKAVANADALAHYHAELAALKARGLTPLVTLNHYTLPSWVHDAVGCHKDLAHCKPRGWVDREATIAEIAKYAGFAAREFGAEVDLWATENEPMAVVLPGYIFPSADRTNPPGLSFRTAEARTVMAALIEAHARMYDAVKANDLVAARGAWDKPAEVGLVYAMVPVQPTDPANRFDVKAAKDVFALYNREFLDGVCKGDIDEDLDGRPVHREDLANRMDFLGINYYFRLRVEGTSDGSPALPDLSALTTFNPLNANLTQDYPKGLYEMAMEVKDRYGLPMFITENGWADPRDDGTTEREMVPTLTWLSRAIRDGAQVRGYFYWTLTDNYEWNHGMDIKMGMFAVDPADPSKTRKPRKAAFIYGEIAKANAISGELMKKYPVVE